MMNKDERLNKVISECFNFLIEMNDYLNKIGAFENKDNQDEWYEIYGGFKEDVIWELISLNNKEED